MKTSMQRGYWNEENILLVQPDPEVGRNQLQKNRINTFLASKYIPLDFYDWISFPYTV